VDLQNLDIKGLEESEAERRFRDYGPNEIPEKKQNWLKKIIINLSSPISLMLVIAACLSLLLERHFDFYLIVLLMVINFSVSIFHELKADNAVEKLRKRLAVTAKVLRSNVWRAIDSRNLVAGDIIEISIGDLIPADIRIITEMNLSVNESAVTGESMPVEKKAGNIIYSGSFVATGKAIGDVVAIGSKTNFGKTILMVEKDRKKSTMEQEIIDIAKFLSAISLVAVAFISAVFVLEHKPLGELILLDLSLIVAGIPAALPTVMTLITTTGILSLAQKDVIVRRLSSLEDLANVTLVLTDKTGTITKNEINVEKIIPYDSKNDADIVLNAYIAAKEDEKSTINQAVARRAVKMELKLPQYDIEDFIPADSDRKRNTIKIIQGNNKRTISAGAPQIIESLCRLTPNQANKLHHDVEEAAKMGYRTIAVCVRDKSLEEKDMQLIGLLLLSDTLHEGAKEQIAFLKKENINVKMVTGDNYFISKRIADEIGLSGRCIVKKDLDKVNYDTYPKEEFDKIAVFSEVLPSDKLNLARLAKKFFKVAVTGDGINDLPALKSADVGIAVSNAVDSVKSSADIVLLSAGLSTVKDALIESRKIFWRLYSYSLYRIAESFRIIVSILVLGALYGFFPLTPLQLIMLALLIDIPIVSLAFDNVKEGVTPATINIKHRLSQSVLFGMVGIANTLLLFFMALYIFKLPIEIIQTLFFLKLTVSGHLLIYAAHTNEKWFKFLPSKEVTLATIGTMLLATIFAVKGIFMTSIPIGLAIFIWVWSFFWMQISDATKMLDRKKTAVKHHPKAPVAQIG
jgi:H+-transporting ATPase